MVGPHEPGELIANVGLTVYSALASFTSIGSIGDLRHILSFFHSTMHRTAACGGGTDSSVLYTATPYSSTRLARMGDDPSRIPPLATNGDSAVLSATLTRVRAPSLFSPTLGGYLERMGNVGGETWD